MNFSRRHSLNLVWILLSSVILLISSASQTRAQSYRYWFVCSYNNNNSDFNLQRDSSNDFYNGYAIGPAGYYPDGYTQSFTDENNQQGHYYIIGSEVNSSAPTYQEGQVYVVSYYDAETGNSLTPKDNTSPLGTNYLGSENGYIVRSGVQNYRFGSGYYEAEADVSLYYFIYFYDKTQKYSDDYYQGYVYAPTGFLSVGQYLYNQPQESGGLPLNEGKGAYYITSVSNGMSYMLDGQEYIFSYYDADTKKTSWGLYNDPNETNSDGASHSLYIADRPSNIEIGYVYDPSVPYDDLYYGATDVTYLFYTDYHSEVNFLAAYVTDLPYWNQPYSYPNSCGLVAMAIVLSYWDRNGYDNLITIDWQTEWPDYAAVWKDPDYASFIEDLWNKYQKADWGANLMDYFSDHGYSTIGFAYAYYCDGEPNHHDRSQGWLILKNALDAGRPVLTSYEITVQTGHAVVVRGYWNDGRIADNNGLGNYEDPPLDWNNTNVTMGYFVDYFVDFYHQ